MQLPRILLAGGEESTFLKLKNAFPTSRYDVSHLLSAHQTLQAAPQAQLIIICSNIQEGMREIITQLRASPLTASIPIIVRSYSKIDLPPSWEIPQISATNIDGLVRLIQKHLSSERTSPQFSIKPNQKESLMIDPTPEENDFEEETVARSSSADMGWSQPKATLVSPTQNPPPIPQVAPPSLQPTVTTSPNEAA